MTIPHQGSQEWLLDKVLRGKKKKDKWWIAVPLALKHPPPAPHLLHLFDKQSGYPGLFLELPPSSPASQTLPSLFPGPLTRIRNGHPEVGLHKEPLVLWKPSQIREQRFPTALAALKSEQKATESIYQKCVPLHWILRCYLYGHLHKAALLKGQSYYFQWNQAPSDLKALAHDLESMLLTFCLISRLSSFWIIPTQTLAALKYPETGLPRCVLGNVLLLKKNMRIYKTSNLENKVTISKPSGVFAWWILTAVSLQIESALEFKCNSLKQELQEPLSN